MKESLVKVPRICIVTPSFNQAEFLVECIDSILSQNYPNLEYIIMDGGSTDGSVEIIKRYEKYLTFWKSGPDGGQYQAINDGFEKTTGEIMAWLNSDDKYHHHAFFKVAYFFGKYREVEWITGRPTAWNRDGSVEHILCEYLPTYSRERYLRTEFGDNMIQQESTFWRRSLWQKAGRKLRGDLKFAGDFELWVRFFRYTKLFTVDTLLGGYRRHENQKAALFLDRYHAEASTIIHEEMALIRQGRFGELVPATAPISFSHQELKSYIDSIWSDQKHPIYKISDDTDIVIESLVKRLRDSHSPELQSTRAALDEIRNSSAWKMTAPFRHLLDLVKRLVGRAEAQ